MKRALILCILLSGCGSVREYGIDDCMAHTVGYRAGPIYHPCGMENWINWREDPFHGMWERWQYWEVGHDRAPWIEDAPWIVRTSPNK